MSYDTQWLFFFKQRIIFHNDPFFFYFLLFRAELTAYGSSQARGGIGAVVAGLHHSHSNTISLTHCMRAGIETASSWMLVRFASPVPHGNSYEVLILLQISRVNS